MMQHGGKVPLGGHESAATKRRGCGLCRHDDLARVAANALFAAGKQ